MFSWGTVRSQASDQVTTRRPKPADAQARTVRRPVQDSTVDWQSVLSDAQPGADGKYRSDD